MVQKVQATCLPRRAWLTLVSHERVMQQTWHFSCFPRLYIAAAKPKCPGKSWEGVVFARWETSVVLQNE